MRKFLLALLLWLSPFIAFLSVVSACSESEKKVASGYTEEQNAWDIKDTVAYLKLLKTWEPEIPVDSVQRKPEINGAPEDVYWYDIEFLSEESNFYAYTGPDGANGFCELFVYNDENGIRLMMEISSAMEVYTQILRRDSMFAIVSDHLDKSYADQIPATACEEDSLAFVEQCAKSKGMVVDQLGIGCTELHLICTKEIMAKKTADEFLDSTAADLKARCADALGISLKDMGNGVMDGKVPWRYLNPEIDYGEVVDERDGQVYKTVVIDTLVWMAENLNYADSINSPSLLGKNWCYGNEPENCLKYGRIYTFGAAVDSFALANDPDNPVQCGNGYVCKELRPIRGLCMEGWHLPSTSEFHVIDDYAMSIATKVYMPKGASTEVTAQAMRSAYIWPYGDDTFGFSLLPGGYYKLDSGQFKDGGQVAYLWSLDYNEDYVYMFVVYDDVSMSSGGTTHVTLEEKYMYALNMRCVKDR